MGLPQRDRSKPDQYPFLPILTTFLKNKQMENTHTIDLLHPRICARAAIVHAALSVDDMGSMEEEIASSRGDRHHQSASDGATPAIPRTP